MAASTREPHPLLLEWLRADSPPARLALPASSAQWSRLLDDAQRHALTPLLARMLGRCRQDRIPARIQEELTRRCAAIAATNLFLWSELRAILLAAQQRRLPCVPIRGIALGWQLHGDIALRPTGDVDLLVPRQDLPAIQEVLQERGFRALEVRPSFAADFEYTLEFFKEDPLPLVVEPHWTIAYPPFHARLDMHGVWARCAQARLDGISTPALGAEDLLIHLCLHLLHHQQTAPLLWRHELDRLIRSSQLNWSIVVEVAGRAGVASLIHAVLSETIRLFRTPIPDDAMEPLAAAAASPQARRTTALLTQESRLRGRERIAMFLQLPSLRAKIRYAASFLFPSAAFIRTQYGVSSWWQIAWTYVRRAAGLLWDGARGFLKLCVAPPASIVRRVGLTHERGTLAGLARYAGPAASVSGKLPKAHGAGGFEPADGPGKCQQRQGPQHEDERS